MILYLENAQDPLKKKIDEFGKAAGYKVNIEELIVFLYLYTCNE